MNQTEQVDFAGLSGMEVLVTGASGGIGSAVARELVSVGARPWLHYRTQRESAIALASELGLDPECVVQGDVASEEDVERMFAAIGGQGHLHGLVVNAGIWEKTTVPLRDMTFDQWRRTLATNLDSAFLCCRAFLQGLSTTDADHAAKGSLHAPSIVLVGSTSGIFGAEGHGDYSASKSAMHGLMLTLKNEIVRQHALGRVNLVNPGWVATAMAQEALQDEALVSRLTSTMPLRKVATPQDVASAVAYLLSGRLAGHVSGQAITVAGGMEGRLLHDP